jgi:hypothetical protein
MRIHHHANGRVSLDQHCYVHSFKNTQKTWLRGSKSPNKTKWTHTLSNAISLTIVKQTTPLLAPLHSRLRDNGTNDASKAVLNGIYDNNLDNLLLETQQYIKELEYIPAVKQGLTINTTLTEKELSKGFLSWRKSTSTSPSDCHLARPLSFHISPTIPQYSTQNNYQTPQYTNENRHRSRPMDLHSYRMLGEKARTTTNQ